MTLRNDVNRFPALLANLGHGNAIMTTPDSQNSIAAAYRWANQVMSVGIEFVLPIAGGWWLDQKYGLDPWLMICGVLLGCLLGTHGMIRLIRDLDK